MPTDPAEYDRVSVEKMPELRPRGDSISLEAIAGRAPSGIQSVLPRMTRNIESVSPGARVSRLTATVEASPTANPGTSS